jgi:predicted transcriptional regulator YheO
MNVLVERMQLTKECIEKTFSSFLDNGSLDSASKKISEEMRNLVFSKKNEITYNDISLIVETLKSLGFFDLRNAVQSLSSSLACSKKTIYNYLYKEKENSSVRSR